MNFRLNKLHVAQNTAERIDNVARIKIARGDLVQHGREQNEVLAADESKFHGPAPSQSLVEMHRRAQSGKSSARNYNANLFHRIKLNGVMLVIGLLVLAG